MVVEEESMVRGIELDLSVGADGEFSEEGGHGGSER